MENQPDNATAAQATEAAPAPVNPPAASPAPAGIPEDSGHAVWNPSGQIKINPPAA